MTEPGHETGQIGTRGAGPQAVALIALEELQRDEYEAAQREDYEALMKEEREESHGLATD